MKHILKSLDILDTLVTLPSFTMVATSSTPNESTSGSVVLWPRARLFGARFAPKSSRLKVAKHDDT